MSSHPTPGPMPSLTSCSSAETNIAYFERRLAQATSQAADAVDRPAQVSHAGLAQLYRLELSQLRTGPAPDTDTSPLLSQAREAGIIEPPTEGPQRPKLTLGWRKGIRNQSSSSATFRLPASMG